MFKYLTWLNNNASQMKIPQRNQFTYGLNRHSVCISTKQTALKQKFEPIMTLMSLVAKLNGIEWTFKASS